MFEEAMRSSIIHMEISNWDEVLMKQTSVINLPEFLQHGFKIEVIKNVCLPKGPHRVCNQAPVLICLKNKKQKAYDHCRWVSY